MAKKILVMASGRGSDFQAIVDHEELGIFRGVEVAALVCNHEDAPVIRRAEKAGVKVEIIAGVTGRKLDSPRQKELAREVFDQECLKIVRDRDIGLVVLAGFDQILTRNFVDECRFKILNVHPAYDLLTYGGKNMVGRKVHELVLNSGANFSGCTVHFVTNELDLGPAILKRRVEVSPGDTPETLEQRILYQEHLAYPEAIQLVSDDRVRVDSERNSCFVDKYSQNWDIEWESRQQEYLSRLQAEK